ncbi:MAG TPA: HlyD family efflux transporter periplasmic adaptor subunit [Gemmatimonadaceae bacterium]|nr:HlyD family efflux transporter periplasmic adaptor subunit [Gemmatimonadaceae bacterium]
MRHTTKAYRLVSSSGLVAACLLVACSGEPEADAYGNFEANEVVVAAQASGQLRSFSAQEGAELPVGAEVGLVDTTQLALERAGIFAQSEASRARVVEAERQIGVLQAHRGVAQRAYERTRRLFEQKAATAQQLDQAERDFRVIDAQIAAARAQREGVVQQSGSTDARVQQIRDLVARSRVVNPVAGTVLATFVRAGEVVQSGQPLYRIASLDTLILRAYLTANQLPRLRLGQRVQVNVDGADSLQSLPGTVTWISAKAEFTPTPIQTRDERADLVYAVKVSVANPQGLLRIGMPADITLPTQLER